MISFLPFLFFYPIKNLFTNVPYVTFQNYGFGGETIALRYSDETYFKRSSESVMRMIHVIKDDEEQRVVSVFIRLVSCASPVLTVFNKRRSIMGDKRGIVRKIHAYVFFPLLFFLAGLQSPAWGAPGAAPVTQWLLVGTFHTADESEILDFPYLPEADLAPSPGDRAGRFSWREVTSKDARIDLQKFDSPVKRYCAAYAFTWIRSVKNQKARLALDSEDGVAVWVNGDEVWRDFIYTNPWHDARRDHVVDVSLKKGWNRLLVKVCELNGGWRSGNNRSFSCSVRSEAGPVFSLTGPEAGKKAGGADFTGLIPAGIDLRASEDGARIQAVVALSNFGAARAENIRCRIVRPSGEILGEAALPSLNSGSFARVVIPIEIDDLPAALSTEGSKIEVQSDTGSFARLVPASLAVRCLCLAAASSGKPGGKAHDLGVRTGAAIETYCLPLSPYTAEARKGLAAFCANDSGKVSDILGGILKRGLIGIPDLSGKTAFITGQAHIDMDWLWKHDETVKIAQDTFRQVAAFMDEYPDFRYIQSQAAVYKAVEKADPALFERIRGHVMEGRWELGGGMWVEADTNLSGGESLARSFLLAQRYFLDRFGRIARSGWLPDNFGHTSQLPQILKLAGCETFYTKRCSPRNGFFWWEAPDCSRVFCYANKFYNQAITTDITREFEDISPGGSTIFIPFGVGDHGGGPTRKDIDTARLLNDTPRFPKMRFSTFENMYDSFGREKAELPVYQGEMQYTFEGCYTSVARVKEGNRRAESALYTSEFLSSLSRFIGGAYPAEDLRQAWETLLFNQFHDILPGSAIHESNLDASAGHTWAISRADEARDAAARQIADRVKLPRGQGQPIVVFNLQPRERASLVEAEIFTHSAPASAHLSYWGDPYDGGRIEPVDVGQGNAPTVMLRDPAGKVIPAQVVWGKNFPPGWRSRILFAAVALPAGGYRAYTVDTTRPGEDNRLFDADSGVFDTDFFTIKTDMSNGDIVSLRDTRTGTEYAKSGMNRLRIYVEDGGANAWNFGGFTRIEDITAVESVTVTERGPVRACIETVKKWGNSRFVQRTYIYRSYPRIDFELDVHWFERYDAAAGAPMLRVVFPVALNNPRFFCHVPFNAVERPTDGREVPAQRWVDISDGVRGIALLNRSKYGHSFQDGELRLSLLRSFNNPDLYPDVGVQHIQYALFPHSGDWKNGVWDEADAFNVPPLAVEPPSSALGRANEDLPAEQSFLSIDRGDVMLSGLKQAEDGGETIVRLVEVNGERTSALFSMPMDVVSCRRLDLIERPLDGAMKPVVNGGKVSVTLRPHEIVTLGMKVGTMTRK
jgi:alpha-mannosidase